MTREIMSDSDFIDACADHDNENRKMIIAGMLVVTGMMKPEEVQKRARCEADLALATIGTLIAIKAGSKPVDPIEGERGLMKKFAKGLSENSSLYVKSLILSMLCGPSEFNFWLSEKLLPHLPDVRKAIEMLSVPPSGGPLAVLFMVGTGKATVECDTKPPE